MIIFHISGVFFGRFMSFLTIRQIQWSFVCTRRRIIIMHMADALLSPAVAGTMYVASAVAGAYSIHEIKKDEDFKKKIPTMGVMGAFVFATQMVNFTIPGTGSSGHLCGGVLLSSILGPYAGFLSMIGVLLIQCLFFADGGILALGANCFNMAFYGCFIGSIIWQLIMRNGMSKRKITISSISGSIISLLLGAFSVTVETLLSDITQLSFKAFVGAMLPIHLVIGLVEGLISAAVLCFVYEARPDILWNPWDSDNKEKINKISYGKFIAVMSAIFLIIGGGISLAASQNPDGLEWSILRLTGDTKTLGHEDKIHDSASQIQDKTSFLPDYSFKDNDTWKGTTVSGIVGGIVTVAVICGAGYLIRFSQKKRKSDDDEQD